jgi:nitrate reductase NapE component
MATINLSDIPKDQIKVVEETNEERTHRLDEQRLDKAHKRKSEWALFIVSVVVVFLILSTSIGIIVWSADPELRKWAPTVVTSVLSGLMGFLVGKAKG